MPTPEFIALQTTMTAMAALPSSAREVAAKALIGASDKIQALEGTPYHEGVLNGLSQIAASDNFPNMTEANFLKQGAGVAANTFRSHLQTLPADQQYAAFKDVTNVASGFLSADAQTKLTELTTQLDKVGPELQQALTYAVAENPHFLPYIIDKATDAGAAGSSNFLEETLDTLFITNDAGNSILDTQKAQVVQNILTEIGNGDKYQNAADFKLLDKVAEASQRLEATRNKPGVSSNEVKNATKDFYLSLHEAGGLLPAFATVNFEDIWELITNIFDPNVGPQAAIDKFVLKSGLDPASEEAETLRHAGELMSKFVVGVGGKPGSGSYGDVISKASKGAYDHQKDAVMGVVDTFQRGISGTSVLTHEQQMIQAARVTDIDDAQFMAKIEDHLRGVATPDLGSVFDAMRHASGNDARAEINAIENAVNKGDVTLTASFQDALNRKDFAEIAETLNKTYNELEEGDTPTVAANDSKFALTAP